MMKLSQEGNGFEFSEDLGENPDKSRAVRSWSMRADQVEAHAPMFAPKLSKGDADMMADIANESRRATRGK
jgi:hypothetical protein